MSVPEIPVQFLPVLLGPAQPGLTKNKMSSMSDDTDDGCHINISNTLLVLLQIIQIFFHKLAEVFYPEPN